VSDSLLITKLTIPPGRPDRVVRPRLLEALSAGSAGKLSLVSAPAGSGKSTLLSEWANAHESLVAWVSLDEEDNDLTRFLTYCVSALRMVHPDTGDSALMMLQARTPPQVDILMTSFVNDLFNIPGNLSLVLDDYHFIESQPIHDAVKFLLDQLPPQMRVVISTRSDPPLPLARLRASGELVELRAADLRFTVQEAVDFLSRVTNVALSEDALVRLDTKIEGWAVGLQLAGLALQGHADADAFVEAFSGSHRYIIDYLADEVMQRQSDEIQSFLQETSILDNLSPALCQAVTKRQDSQDVLSKLEQANLFLVPLDDRREWYRYHHLFRDALRFRLQELIDDELVKDLHRRAAIWYAQNDFTDEALHHWLEAREHVEAANLIQAVGHEMLARAQLSKLRRWIDKLPEELVRSRPWLSIQYAWLLNLMGQLDEMELRLQDAERAAANEETNLAAEIKGNIATVRAGAARKQNNSEAAISYLREALENLPADDVLVRCSAHFNLGSTYLDIGEVVKGEQELRSAVRGAEVADNLYTIIAGKSYAADAYVLQGKLRKAASLYQEAIGDGLARNNGRPMPISGYAYGGSGQVHYEQNELDAAERHLSQALELGELLADWTIVRRALPTLARLQQAKGILRAAESSWERAFDLANEYGDQPGAAYLDAYRARMWLVQATWKSDDSALTAAFRWAETYRTGQHSVTDYRETFAQLTLAWAEIAQGDAKQSASRLEQMAEVARNSERTDCLIKILACMALARDKLGQSDEAQSTLQHAVELAAPEGYCRTFVDLGPPMHDLLRLLAASNPDLEYARTLHMAFPAEIRARPSTSLAEPLTNRELDVLRLLAAGFSNQEIADELVIALGTVKQYNHIIFRKLDVRTRAEAAIRASELNLL
jgi:LuxR family maltose regulon positive regulatory protein